MFCRNCGKTTVDTNEFCPNCGARPLAGRTFCNACGATTTELTEMCPRCLTRVAFGPPVMPKASSSPSPAYVPPTPPQTVHVQAPAATAPAKPVAAPAMPGEVSPKKRLVTVLLAFFVGTLGAHRFYTGKIGTGVAMLLLTVAGFTIAIASRYIPRGMGPGDIIENVGLYLQYGVIIWVLVDFIIACLGKFKDNRGRTIARW